ncbi:MAG: LPS export ABC transporter periplasmic protein LptC [Sphaerochaetaceae bacterium]|nr:LPS export ABC transporter periplasmic protein LptC [Sphaerochaetaceae bacterium]
MRKRGVLYTVVLSLILILSVSCSKGGQSSVRTEGLLPDIIMENATYVFGDPDSQPLKIQASEIKVFNKTKEVYFTGITFTQEDGKISGSCKSGKSLENKVISLEGEVSVYNSEDDVRILAEKILWDDEYKELTSDGVVTVVYETDNTVTGEGFTAKINENVYEFDKITEGRFESE